MYLFLSVWNWCGTFPIHCTDEVYVRCWLLVLLCYVITLTENGVINIFEWKVSKMKPGLLLRDLRRMFRFFCGMCLVLGGDESACLCTQLPLPTGNQPSTYSNATQDCPAFFCLTSRYQPCMSPILLLLLPPDTYLSFLSPTKVSSSDSLIPVC